MGTDNHNQPWQDTTRSVADRVADLLAELTLEEKVAQLYGVWVGVETEGADVAPYQHDLADPELDFQTLIRSGLGQLTRPFGTAPVDPAEGAKALARLQSDVVAGNRFGIPALVHEECLTGFMTWQATVYPTPLAWGATFDPALVERMAAQIGATMHAVGVHQGLSPVVDVTRDARWGRTEETMGEDPYLVGTLGTAYVRGLQSAGVLATLKHFAGYSASNTGRNLGPVSIGPRELADVLLPPFEMAIHDGGAGSVMQSYTAIDGMPVAADPTLLTTLLRDEWGFTGTVVADYFGVSFLELLHGVTDSPQGAAALALAAGVDVELPTVRCYGDPLVAAVRAGTVDEALVDRAVTRVLHQKCALGLLDPEWNPLPPALQGPDGTADADGTAGADAEDVDLDPPDGRDLARTLAEESVVLLRNDGTLPVSDGIRVAVVGPLGDDPRVMFGCYSFPNHVGQNRADGGADDESAGSDPTSALATAAGPLGVPVPTVLQALREEFPGTEFVYVPAGDGAQIDREQVPAAVAAAGDADVCLAVLGDRSGLFGRGTVGEGCDAGDLSLPGGQEDLLSALATTDTPVAAVLLTGRPYALGSVADDLPAVVQAFFPGQAGAHAVAGVLSGRVNPSGRLPVSVPVDAGGQPASYLAPPLGQQTAVSAADPTPLFPFGHGLSYTTFEWDDPRVDDAAPATAPAAIATDGTAHVSVRVRNTGDRSGVEVVQLYLHDPVAQVTRPVVRLIGYARVPLEPGQARRVAFTVPAEAAAFTGRAGHRVVEPGALELRLGASCADIRARLALELVGPERTVDHGRRLTTEVTTS